MERMQKEITDLLKDKHRLNSELKSSQGEIQVGLFALWNCNKLLLGFTRRNSWLERQVATREKYFQQVE